MHTGGGGAAQGGGVGGGVTYPAGAATVLGFDLQVSATVCAGGVLGLDLRVRWTVCACVRGFYPHVSEYVDPL